MMKNTVYLLYYDFKHTSGNHAGMAYFSQQLANHTPRILLVKHINQEYRGGRFVAYAYAFLIFLYLSIVLRKGDKVIFMEYLSKHIGHQDVIAKQLLRFGFGNTLIGLVHLGGSHLLSLYGSKEQIAKRLAPLSRVVVFGSSLAEFIRQAGYQGAITHTFHYVDTLFYKPAASPVRDEQMLHVLFLGSLLRNFEQLEAIIAACSAHHIVFHIGMGKSKRNLGTYGDRVHVYGYLTEVEMLQLMQSCDVNLSVLDDTVGSNVITSTLAVGLVQVASDVGSIRDYCDENDSFFCKETMDYVEALNKLAESPSLKEQMKAAARSKGTSFDLKRSIRVFTQLMKQ